MEDIERKYENLRSEIGDDILATEALLKSGTISKETAEYMLGILLRYKEEYL